MVGIVAVTRFCTSGSKAFSEYINYIDRDNATRKDKMDQYNLFEEYLGYMENEEKTVVDDYKNNTTEEVSALFTRDKDHLSLDEKTKIKDLFKAAQNNESNMWQTVISFDNRYLEQIGVYKDNILDEKKLITSSRAAIDAMLHKEGLDNAVWTASFHYNTDNIHIHIATIEPTPMREKKIYREWVRNPDGRIKMQRNQDTGKLEKVPLLDENGNQVVKEQYKGTFKQSSIETLKSTMVSELETDKEQMIEISNMLRDIIKDKKDTSLLNKDKFKERLINLYKEIKATGTERRYWNYNQKTLHHLKGEIDDLSDFFISSYHQDEFKQIVSEIEDLQAKFTNTYGGSNSYLENKLYNPKDGLYPRLGNAILKELQTYDRARSNQLKTVSEAIEMLDKTSSKYDPKAAIFKLEKASEMGNSFAQNRLGLMYLKGEFVKKDKVRAMNYFNRSAANGNRFGTMMLSKKEGYSTKDYGKNYHVSRYIERSTNRLRRNLEQNYESWKNKAAYEELQRDINKRTDNYEIS